MQKILIGLASAVALTLSAPASAADLAARPYTKAPMVAPAPIYTWTGFYVGVQGGGGWDTIETADVRAARRKPSAATARGRSIGFRCALTP